VETPALRQVVLLARDLARSLDETRAFLGLRPGIRDEHGMAQLGFEHEVLAIDHTFVEVVSPLSPDSSSGRLLARRGESGYMVVLQVADLDAVLARGAGIGLTPILHEVFEGNPMTQWHPRDLGTLAEIDEMRVAEWHFCPALSDTGCTEVVADIVAVDIAVPDPAGYARRWATLLGLEPDPDPAATQVRLGTGTLRFVPDHEHDGAGAGLGRVVLAPGPVVTADRRATLCGVEFAIAAGPSP
jgi:Glyoxalase-like domain